MRFFTCLRVGLVVGLALLPLSLSAMENGRAIAAISLAAKQQNALPLIPWISTLRITGNDSTAIHLADDRQLMQRPDRVASYNSEQLYDVSRFYKPDSIRINLVMHYAGRKAGEIISVGVDSGYRAKKITIKPALFIGYARSIQVGRGKHFTFSAGGWLGGKVTHKACRDSFERAYYCRNLTAWSDFHPQRHQLQYYYQLVYAHAF